LFGQIDPDFNPMQTRLDEMRRQIVDPSSRNRAVPMSWHAGAALVALPRAACRHCGLGIDAG
jgi:hypothetical protein